jgi:flagellar protein FliO/FliZ
MNTPSEIWVAFARTFSMLVLVLAVLLLVFYLIKRFSTLNHFKGGKNHIRIISAHHFSAKEKLVLVDVMGEILLLGVTPQNISKLSSVDHPMESLPHEPKSTFRFSEFLSRKLGNRETKSNEDINT